jgi:ribonucleoside-diphosphate reductase alpha chain
MTGTNQASAGRAGHAQGDGQASTGLKVERVFTTAGQDPFATIEWARRTSKIANPDGSVVFEMRDAEIPARWSQVATDIMVSKYFRKAGVPQVAADGTPEVDAAGNPARDEE